MKKKNKRFLRDSAVVVTAGVVFGLLMAAVFWLYQLFDSLWVPCAACAIFAVLGALEYVMLKRTLPVFVSLALSFLTVFVGAVVLFTDFNGANILDIIFLAAFLAVPMVGLVGIAPLAFAPLGALITEFIYKKLLRRCSQLDNICAQDGILQSEDGEQIEKFEEGEQIEKS